MKFGIYAINPPYFREYPNMAVWLVHEGAVVDTFAGALSVAERSRPWHEFREIRPLFYALPSDGLDPRSEVAA